MIFICGTSMWRVGNTMSVAVQNPSALWDEAINEFNPIFHVTFKLHPKHRFDHITGTPINVPNFALFSSISERKIARLQLQDDEKGNYLPLSRSEW